jgi:4-hydroxy-tetrahydrodipicolinate synthase
MPAITTPFHADLSVDHEFLKHHVRHLLTHGVTGIVTPGSLGEGATLEHGEKNEIWNTCVNECGDVPVIAAVSALSTSRAVAIARDAERAGCQGLMVLPPYVYRGSKREMLAYFSTIIESTPLSCMLYNNPIAYGTDLSPEDVAHLAQRHQNLHAVKESSADVRRVTGIRALCGDRLAIFVGVDDLIVEGIAAGAVGWIAGLVNALPEESMKLFRACIDGRAREVDALYQWFLPLLRMDTTYDFVQLIKLIQREVGIVGAGGAVTRPPRLLPEGAELERVIAAIRSVLDNRPNG